MELRFGECSTTVMNRPDGSAKIYASPPLVPSSHKRSRRQLLHSNLEHTCPEFSSSSFLDIVTSVTVVLGDD